MEERRELPSFKFVDELDIVNPNKEQDYLRPAISSDVKVRMADLAIQLAAKYDTPLTALYVDLDNLKEVNESVGHIAGDELLRVVDGVFRNFVRVDTDFIFYDNERVGGDEWVVLSPSDEQGAKLIRDRLTSRAEEGIQLIADESIKRCSPGVSIGFATISARDNISGIELLKRADEDLQRVKRSKDPQLGWWKTKVANLAEFLAVKVVGLTPGQFVKYIRRKNAKAA